MLLLLLHDSPCCVYSSLQFWQLIHVREAVRRLSLQHGLSGRRRWNPPLGQIGDCSLACETTAPHQPVAAGNSRRYTRASRPVGNLVVSAPAGGGPTPSLTGDWLRPLPPRPRAARRCRCSRSTCRVRAAIRAIRVQRRRQADHRWLMPRWRIIILYCLSEPCPIDNELAANLQSVVSLWLV